jgi:hypothetical protein
LEEVMPVVTKQCFVGWWRPDPKTPWRRIVHGSDERAALNRLLNAVPGGDKVVLPAGNNLNARDNSETAGRGLADCRIRGRPSR